MSTFACNPEDFESLPWVPGCSQCEGLHRNAEPGLFTWISTVATHFETAHDIGLVGA